MGDGGAPQRVAPSLREMLGLQLMRPAGEIVDSMFADVAKLVPQEKLDHLLLARNCLREDLLATIKAFESLIPRDMHDASADDDVSVRELRDEIRDQKCRIRTLASQYHIAKDMTLRKDELVQNLRVTLWKDVCHIKMLLRHLAEKARAGEVLSIDDFDENRVQAECNEEAFTLFDAIVEEHATETRLALRQNREFDATGYVESALDKKREHQQEIEKRVRQVALEFQETEKKVRAEMLAAEELAERDRVALQHLAAAQEEEYEDALVQQSRAQAGRVHELETELARMTSEVREVEDANAALTADLARLQERYDADQRDLTERLMAAFDSLDAAGGGGPAPAHEVLSIGGTVLDIAMGAPRLPELAVTSGAPLQDAGGAASEAKAGEGHDTTSAVVPATPLTDAVAVQGTVCEGRGAASEAQPPRGEGVPAAAAAERDTQENADVDITAPPLEAKASMVSTVGTDQGGVYWSLTGAGRRAVRDGIAAVGAGGACGHLVLEVGWYREGVRVGSVQQLDGVGNISSAAMQCVGTVLARGRVPHNLGQLATTDTREVQTDAVTFAEDLTPKRSPTPGPRGRQRPASPGFSPRDGSGFGGGARSPQPQLLSQTRLLGGAASAYALDRGLRGTPSPRGAQSQSTRTLRGGRGGSGKRLTPARAQTDARMGATRRGQQPGGHTTPRGGAGRRGSNSSAVSGRSTSGGGGGRRSKAPGYFHEQDAAKLSAAWEGGGAGSDPGSSPRSAVSARSDGGASGISRASSVRSRGSGRSLRSRSPTGIPLKRKASSHRRKANSSTPRSPLKKRVSSRKMPSARTPGSSPRPAPAADDDDVLASAAMLSSDDDSTATLTRSASKTSFQGRHDGHHTGGQRRGSSARTSGGGGGGISFKGASRAEDERVAVYDNDGQVVGYVPTPLETTLPAPEQPAAGGQKAGAAGASTDGGLAPPPVLTLDGPSPPPSPSWRGSDDPTGAAGAADAVALPRDIDGHQGGSQGGGSGSDGGGSSNDNDNDDTSGTPHNMVASPSLVISPTTRHESGLDFMSPIDAPNGDACVDVDVTVQVESATPSTRSRVGSSAEQRTSDTDGGDAPSHAHALARTPSPGGSATPVPFGVEVGYASAHAIGGHPHSWLPYGADAPGMDVDGGGLPQQAAVVGPDGRVLGHVPAPPMWRGPMRAAAAGAAASAVIGADGRVVGYLSNSPYPPAAAEKSQMQAHGAAPPARVPNEIACGAAAENVDESLTRSRRREASSRAPPPHASQRQPAPPVGLGLGHCYIPPYPHISGAGAGAGTGGLYPPPFDPPLRGVNTGVFTPKRIESIGATVALHAPMLLFVAEMMWDLVHSGLRPAAHGVAEGLVRTVAHHAPAADTSGYLAFIAGRSKAPYHPPAPPRKGSDLRKSAAKILKSFDDVYFLAEDGRPAPPDTLDDLLDQAVMFADADGGAQTILKRFERPFMKPMAPQPPPERSAADDESTGGGIGVGLCLLPVGSLPRYGRARAPHTDAKASAGPAPPGAYEHYDRPLAAPGPVLTGVPLSDGIGVAVGTGAARVAPPPGKVRFRPPTGADAGARTHTQAPKHAATARPKHPRRRPGSAGASVNRWRRLVAAPVDV